MKTKEVTINHRYIRYHEWSEGCGLPTILCLHGLGSTSLSFIEIADYLSSEYNVISVDTPGHGMTKGFENIVDYTMDNLVDWLNAFVDEIGLEKFILIAHSYGGDIAIHYAICYEHRVAKLVLLDGGYYNKEIGYDCIKDLIKKGEWIGEGITSLEDECIFYMKDFDEYYFRNFKEYIEFESRNYNRLSDKLIFALKDLMVECEDGIRFAAKGEVAVGAINAMYNNPSSIYLNNINTPTLLLVSTEPKHYYKLRKNLLENIHDNANIIYDKVDNTSHFLHWDKPEYVFKRIKEFLIRGL